ncbi:hypothetical protein GCM10010417_40530 [Streptomyces carpaticus]
MAKTARTRSAQLPDGSRSRNGTVFRYSPRASVPSVSSSRPLAVSPTSRSVLPVSTLIARRCAASATALNGTPHRRATSWRPSHTSCGNSVSTEPYPSASLCTRHSSGIVSPAGTDGAPTGRRGSRQSGRSPTRSRQNSSLSREAIAAFSAAMKSRYVDVGGSGRGSPPASSSW